MQRRTTPITLGLLALLAILAAACSPFGPHAHVLYVPGGPAERPATVNPAEAARLISAYRSENRLGPVVVDQQLVELAENYARAMASAGEVSHTIGGNLTRRTANAGYEWIVIAENVAGGHGDLAQVLAHWQVSPGHDANLLLDRVTEIGIATAFNGDATLRNFWVLILAAPEPPDPSGNQSIVAEAA